MGPEDRTLVERAKRDPHAFASLYEKYVDKIYTYLYYRVHDREAAEELTSMTFQRALEALPRYEFRGAPFEAWLYRIAHNAVANWFRDNERRKTIPLDSVRRTHTESHSVDEIVLLSEMREELRQLVRKLPSEWQEVLILKFAEGATHAEIGRILGKSESAVKSIYYRTLKSLRKAFRERGFIK